MRVFLSYASEDRPIAERICRVLESEKHDVFFDRDDLAGGDAYGARIRAAIEKCDVFVFLVSPSAISASYALTELSLIESRPPNQRPPVIPVLVAPTDLSKLPPLLRPLTVLEPQGDLAAEVAARVHTFDVVPEAQRIRLLATPGNDGWTVYIEIAETDVREIFYRLSDTAPFVSTGLNDYRSPHTGRQLPNTLITLSGRLGDERQVHVKYRDGRDREIGPFIIHFYPRAQYVRWTKQVLAQTPVWIACADNPPAGLLVYFSHLLSYKNAFQEIRYSVDDESVSSKLRFATDWTRRSVPGVKNETDDIYITIPTSSDFVSVQLLFIDGTVSEVHRFVIAEMDVAGRS